MNRSACMMLIVATAASGASADMTIPVEADYMSSGFFQSDYLRGDEIPSGRATNRATSTTIFGVTGETTYFSFDFDPAAFDGPVTEASFVVEVSTTGFFGDPTPSNPADISLHSVTTDPRGVVDRSLASGPGSWLDFRDTEIVPSSIVSTKTVRGMGVNQWDITGLVNEWIANGDSNVAYTIGTSALLDPDPGTAIAFVNSSFAGLAGTEFTARIIIPAPGAAGTLALLGVVATRRRR